MSIGQVTQEDVSTVYDHILESLQQGRQPGTFKQISAATGIDLQTIGPIIKNLCATDTIRASRPDGSAKYKPLQYDIPGHEFPAESKQGRTQDPAAERLQLTSKTLNQIRSLHEQGLSIPEIVELVPDYIDGTRWMESSIESVIKNIRPNYAYALSKKL